mmetsp:Transcript_24844/g.86512  ORF Transcript_24844/g.86512 Transcript_24844/m.86512 type:complete len:998 (-) Transcript_24844:74-3067(-)
MAADEGLREAFTLVDVIPDFEEKITALAYKGPAKLAKSPGQHLYVGTATGKIAMYKIEEQTDGSGYFRPRRLETKIIVPKKKIDQLEAVAELNCLIVLCDGRVTVHNALSLEQEPSSTSKNRGKGAYMFSLNQQRSGVHRLCIAFKRKLSLYEYSQAAYVWLKDLGIPDVPLSIMWYGKWICVGYKREYNLLDDETGDVHEIGVPLDNRSTPVIKLMPESEMLLASQENMGIYVTFNERGWAPAMRGTMAWGHSPTVLAYCFPYVISASPKSHNLEIHSARDQRLVQQIGVPRITKESVVALVDARSMVDDSGMDDAARGRNPVFVAMSSGRIMRLQPKPFDTQVEELLKAKQVDAAFDLLDNTTEARDKVAKLSRFHLDAGRVLWLDLDFEEALAHLTHARLDPRELIAMYPELQHADFHYRPKYFSALLLNGIVEGTKTAADGATIYSDAPWADEGETGVQGGDDDGDGGSGGGAAGGAGGAAAGGSGGAAAGRGRVAATDEGDVAMPSFLDVTKTTLRSVRSSVAKPKQAVSESTRLMIPFIEDCRKRLADPDAKPELAMAIDTALLKLYVMHRHDDRLEALAAAPNHVHLEDAKAFLQKNKLYNVLALLYKSANQPRDALHVWKLLGKGEVVEEGKDGVAETISYLSELSHQELIMVYADWVLKKVPEQAMEIFTANKRRDELDPDQVLEFLGGFRDISTTLVQLYLEFLINVQHSTSRDYATRLAQLYLKTVMTLRETLSSVEASATHDDRPAPGSEPGNLGAVRGKLITLLEKSTHYDVDELLHVTRDSTLFEENVILHSKRGDHQAALEVLVYQLADNKAAEKYCVAHSPAESPEADPFILLLQLYFNPRDKALAQSLRDSALALLRDHAKEINSVRVMEILPDDTPVVEVGRYLSTIVPHTAHRLREGQVVHNLRKLEHIRLAGRRAEMRQHNVVITPDTLCAHCGKRINNTWFALYPNDTVMHYKCAKDSLTYDFTRGVDFAAAAPRR